MSVCKHWSQMIQQTSVRVSLESIMQGGSMTEWDYSVGAAHCVDGKKS